MFWQQHCQQYISTKAMQVRNDKNKSLDFLKINSQWSSMRESQGKIFLHLKKELKKKIKRYDFK
jgi:hypothetical protein